MLRHRVSLLLGMFWLTCSTVVLAAPTLTAHFNRQSIALNETVQLTLILEGKTTTASPNFSALQKDFEILGTASSSQVRITNGKSQSQTQWLVSLLPKHTGHIEIPAISLEGLHTQPLALTISSTANSPNAEKGKAFFITTSLTPKTPYVQSQVIYRIKIFYALALQSGSLSELKVKDAVVKRLGNDTTYETTRQGKTYKVIERRYAIFPQQSGKLIINPQVFTGQIIDNHAINSSGFGGMFGNNIKAIRDVVPATHLMVKPIPKAGKKANNWLPATKLSLKEHWSADPKTFQVGIPITRTISIDAQGVTGAQLPQLSPKKLKHANVYSDQPIIKTVDAGSALVGLRQEKIAIVPTKSGKLHIPPIVVQWWNTKTHRLEQARLPGKTYHVSKGQAPQITPQSAMAVSGTSTHEALFWPGLTALFCLLWLGTMGSWFFYANRKKPSTLAPDEPPTAQKVSRRDIRQACEVGDARGAKTAILQWARQTFPDKKINNLQDISQILPHTELQEIFKALDEAIYSQQAKPWDGQACWLVLKKRLNKLATSQAARPVLPEL